MKVVITPNAAEDIYSFYANAASAHPNTLPITEAISQYCKVLDMITEAAQTFITEREPLLNTLKEQGVSEPMPTSDKKWYFTLKIDGEQLVVDNAIYFKNMSNRAYRRGNSNPTANLKDDNRQNQRYIGSGKSFENSSISRRVNVLNEHNPNYTVIRLTEKELHSIIKESVSRILNNHFNKQRNEQPHI